MPAQQQLDVPLFGMVFQLLISEAECEFKRWGVSHALSFPRQSIVIAAQAGDPVKQLDVRSTGCPAFAG
jgi:hypothetical protein